MRRLGFALAGLLAFGMIGSLRAQTPDIPMAPDSIAKAHNTIMLTLPADGGYTINQQPVALEDLGHQFYDIFHPRPAKILVISWDRARPAADVVAVVQLARSEGITVYRLPFRPNDI